MRFFGQAQFFGHELPDTNTLNKTLEQNQALPKSQSTPNEEENQSIVLNVSQATPISESSNENRAPSTSTLLLPEFNLIEEQYND